MAKSRERLLAREMRRKGESIREIAKKLNVSVSSSSLWCRDIMLTKKQVDDLFAKQNEGKTKGRMKAWGFHRSERRERVTRFGKIGFDKVGKIINRELFLIGLALYWAEGSKKERRIIFVNSDPDMICLFIRWMRECFDVKVCDFTCRVQINKIHLKRVGVIEDYWSSKTGISKSQFTKPSLIYSISKKFYENPEDYFGVLAVKVKRSTNMSYLIDGGIQHLREHGS